MIASPKHAGALKAQFCPACCFYRLIELESGRARELCALTGEKRPMAGMNGCCFIPGSFLELDGILRLPKSRLSGNTGDPNQTKRGDRFSKTGKRVVKTKRIANFTIDDFVGKPIKHTTGKGSLAHPGNREAPVARLARECA